MKLSIVTINRDNAAGLRATLGSTFGAQPGFDDWEQIVVDGASTDGSFAEVDRYRSDPHLGWTVSEPDTGIYNAMNKGAAHARGDYLLFLNSGDTLLPDVLAKVFAEPWDEDIAFGDIWVESDGNSVLRNMEEADDIGFGYFLFRSLPHQATFFARKLHERLGGYDESLRIYADRKFCLRAAQEGTICFRRFPFAISRFRWGGLSSDPGRNAERRAECRAMLEPFFGRNTVRLAMGPDTPPKRSLPPGLRPSILEELLRDKDFARAFLRVNDAVRAAWRTRAGRFLLDRFAHGLERHEARALRRKNGGSPR